MTLRNARILSSCNDASNSQTQRMNVNIKVEEGVKLPRFEESLNSKHNNPQTIPQQAIPTNEVRGTFGPQQTNPYPQVNPLQANPVNFTQITPE